MIKVACPSCASSYDLDPRRLPAKGLKMRCPSCGESFHVGPGGVVHSEAGAEETSGSSLKPAVASTDRRPPPPPVPKGPRGGSLNAGPPAVPLPKNEGCLRAISGSTQMWGAGEVDLPAPVAGPAKRFEAPPTLSEADFIEDGLSDQTTAFERLDLPAPKGATTTGATPKTPRGGDAFSGMDLPDLPAPKGATPTGATPTTPKGGDAFSGMDLPDLPAPQGATPTGATPTTPKGGDAFSGM
ncbi:MAG: zinc-ribbon domain-containing protein, partial [Myxococcota bacterium]